MGVSLKYNEAKRIFLLDRMKINKQPASIPERPLRNFILPTQKR